MSYFIRVSFTKNHYRHLIPSTYTKPNGHLHPDGSLGVVPGKWARIFNQPLKQSAHDNSAQPAEPRR
jgi:hypothetical protein